MMTVMIFVDKVMTVKLDSRTGLPPVPGINSTINIEMDKGLVTAYVYEHVWRYGANGSITAEVYAGTKLA